MMNLELINITICTNCQNYFSTDDGICPHCYSTRKDISYTIKKKLTQLQNNRVVNKSDLVHKNIEMVHPPPVPKINEAETQRLMEHINVHITQEHEPQPVIKRTRIYRRGIILVFERTSFELLLQQPWLKKGLGNEIQISFERNFSVEEGLEHVIETILRLKIMYTNLSGNSLVDFLQDRSIHDEMAFKINNAFVVVKDSPLTTEWYNFLTQQSKTKFIYYLSRRPLDSTHYNNFSLLDSEELFISLIKRLLVIQDHIEIKIVNQKLNPRITNLPSPDVNVPEYKTSKLAIASTVSNCMGHGGPIDEPHTCKICQGSLCSICVESFLICPGSMATDLHKFET